MTYHEQFGSTDTGHKRTEQKDQLKNLLLVLDDRERKIIGSLYGLDNENEKTLKETGKIYNLTRERIRQVRKEAFKKIRDKISQEELEMLFRTS